MATKNTAKKIQEQITEAVKNPQEFATNLNEKNQEFAKEAQQILLAFPQELLNQQKEAQEKLSVCVKKIQDIVSTQPVDFIQLQQTIFEFYTDSVSYQTKLAQEQISKAQSFFGIYTK